MSPASGRRFRNPRPVGSAEPKPQGRKRRKRAAESSIGASAAPLRTAAVRTTQPNQFRLNIRHFFQCGDMCFSSSSFGAETPVMCVVRAAAARRGDRYSGRRVHTRLSFHQSIPWLPAPGFDSHESQNPGVRKRARSIRVHARSVVRRSFRLPRRVLCRARFFEVRTTRTLFCAVMSRVPLGLRAPVPRQGT